MDMCKSKTKIVSIDATTQTTFPLFEKEYSLMSNNNSAKSRLISKPMQLISPQARARPMLTNLDKVGGLLPSPKVKNDLIYEYGTDEVFPKDNLYFLSSHGGLSRGSNSRTPTERAVNDQHRTITPNGLNSINSRNSRKSSGTAFFAEEGGYMQEFSPRGSSSLTPAVLTER